LGEPAIKAGVDRAVAAARVIAAEPETDGSWKVTMAVPIEAIRQALAGGPRAHGRDDASPVIVVEGAAAVPAVGYQLGALAAPTIFVKAVPDWAKGAPRVKARARATKDGVIDVPAGKATGSTLFVIVTKS
ncbi:MAG: hypothetical protein M3680_13385, partial [Myxococcota bacterium]|nr:hypothetical protein [Myxococcota bacterium]